MCRCRPDTSEIWNLLSKCGARKAGELAEKSISVIDIGLMRRLAIGSGNFSSFVGGCHLLTGYLCNCKFRGSLLLSLKARLLDGSTLVKKAAENRAPFCSTYTNSCFLSCSYQLGAQASTVIYVCLCSPHLSVSLSV